VSPRKRQGTRGPSSTTRAPTPNSQPAPPSRASSPIGSPQKRSAAALPRHDSSSRCHPLGVRLRARAELAHGRVGPVADGEAVPARHPLEHAVGAGVPIAVDHLQGDPRAAAGALEAEVDVAAHAQRQQEQGRWPGRVGRMQRVPFEAPVAAADGQPAREVLDRRIAVFERGRPQPLGRALGPCAVHARLVLLARARRELARGRQRGERARFVARGEVARGQLEEPRGGLLPRLGCRRVAGIDAPQLRLDLGECSSALGSVGQRVGRVARAREDRERFGVLLGAPLRLRGPQELLPGAGLRRGGLRERGGDGHRGNGEGERGVRHW
jgi:hypothetical protein